MVRKLILIGAATLAVATVTGVGYAAIPSSNGTISACKDPKGALKVIDAEAGQTCSSNQQPLTWNEQGPAGPQGPVGETGAAGAQGPKGDTGIAHSTTRTAGIAFTRNGVTGEHKHQAAMCQAGETVVGGGYRIPDNGFDLGGEYLPIFVALQSRPANASGDPAVNGQEPRGWYVEVMDGSDFDATVAITVLCASA